MSFESDSLELALATVRRAGASAADAVLVSGEVLEARVRGSEIDFVKQARDKTLGLRAFVQGKSGLRTALTSTSDLSPDVVGHMAEETIALAKATEEDPMAGLPRRWLRERRSGPRSVRADRSPRRGRRAHRCSAARRGGGPRARICAS